VSDLESHVSGDVGRVAGEGAANLSCMCQVAGGAAVALAREGGAVELRSGADGSVLAGFGGFADFDPARRPVQLAVAAGSTGVEIAAFVGADGHVAVCVAPVATSAAAAMVGSGSPGLLLSPHGLSPQPHGLSPQPHGLSPQQHGLSPQHGGPPRVHFHFPPPIVLSQPGERFAAVTAVTRSLSATLGAQVWVSRADACDVVIFTRTRSAHSTTAAAAAIASPQSSAGYGPAGTPTHGGLASLAAHGPPTEIVRELTLSTPAPVLSMVTCTDTSRVWGSTEGGVIVWNVAGEVEVVVEMGRGRCGLGFFFFFFPFFPFFGVVSFQSLRSMSILLFVFFLFFFFLLCFPLSCAPKA
jgi:hypothetical protein